MERLIFRRGKPRDLSKGARGISAVGVGIVLMMVLFFNTITRFLADLAWFKETGYTSTFLIQMFAKVYLSIPFFVFFFLILFFYGRRLKKAYEKEMEVSFGESSQKLLNRSMLAFSVLFAAGFAWIFGGTDWMQLLQFLHATPFGEADPLFHRDIGFYVFKLPFVRDMLMTMIHFLLFLAMLTAGFLVFLTIYRPPSLMPGEDEVVRPLYPRNNLQYAQRKILHLITGHLYLLAAVLLLLYGLYHVLRVFDLLYSPTGVVYGAGYMDMHVRYPVSVGKAILSVATAVGLVVLRKKNRQRLILIAAGIMVGVSILGSGLEAAVQNFVVLPDELSKERPYIQLAIESTRKAYGLDRIHITDFPANQDLKASDIAENPQTISNISLNDYRPTKEAFNQLQGLRAYYNFINVDTDRYVLNDRLTQVFLSVREIDKTRLTGAAQNWINTRLKYTHGYGVAVAPVNKLTDSGQPDMIVKNVPVVSEYPILNLEQPRVYFGEITNDYVIVNTKETEFDYPQGEGNAMTVYDGKGGIPLGFFHRLLFAVQERDLKILISSSIHSESRILINRSVLQRVEKIAPFLTYDPDIYPVVADGRLFYVTDAYTTSNAYPYSQPYKENGGTNYIRNSVKVVVDAYHGDVNFYAVDDGDPMLQTYKGIFPGLFKEKSAMDPVLVEHLKYPRAIFDIRSKMYSTFHITNPDSFFNGEDKWQIAKENQGDQASDMESLYSTFKLPDQEKAEFLLSIPYTPNLKQNLTAFLIARSDKEAYGEMALYRMPKDNATIGPEQIEAKFKNNPLISKDLTLWNNGGSQVIRGNILTIPIEKALIYVQPLYIRASSENAIPEVKRILLGYNGEVVMADNMVDALTQMFGHSSPQEKGDGEGAVVVKDQKPDPSLSSSAGSSTPGGQGGDLPDTATWSKEQLIQEAGRRYEAAQEALKRGSLAEYQHYVDQIGILLQQLEKGDR